MAVRRAVSLLMTLRLMYSNMNRDTKSRADHTGQQFGGPFNDLCHLGVSAVDTTKRRIGLLRQSPGGRQYFCLIRYPDSRLLGIQKLQLPSRQSLAGFLRYRQRLVQLDKTLPAYLASYAYIEFRLHHINHQPDCQIFQEWLVACSPKWRWSLTQWPW